jgi:hypothetical protein
MRQYRTILYGLVTAIALLLAACSADDDQTVSSVDAIAFDAQLATDKGMTRTPATAINDETSLQTGGFGVFACYTGLYSYIDSDVHPDFMYNEHVTWNGTNSVWEYFPLKYWPNGEGEVSGQSGVNRHYVSFFAYAPYSNNDSSDPATNPAGYCIPSFSKQGDVGNPWLTYRLHTDVDHQVDLLHAQLLNQTKSDQTVVSRLNFTFNHALACVGDQVNISCSDDLKTLIKEKVDTESSITEGSLTLKSVSIKYTLIERGRLIMWNGGEANWQSIASGNRMTTRTVTLTPSAPYELP